MLNETVSAHAASCLDGGMDNQLMKTPVICNYKSAERSDSSLLRQGHDYMEEGSGEASLLRVLFSHLDLL